MRLQEFLENTGTKARMVLFLSIVLAVVITAVSQEFIATSVASALGAEAHNYGVYKLEQDTSECNFYTREEQLVGGLNSILEVEGTKCAPTFQEYLLRQKIRSVNESDATEEVKRLASKAGAELESGNLSGAKNLLDGVKVHKTYELEE